MRTHTTGIAWWQGSSGPYWGHNAIIRLRPFVELCDLPVLPSGPILSHDQVEAALMRAGGMEVRVIADEFESWEENPARLPDFVRRDLRWCQGNLQYWRLLGRPGFRPMGRFQLGNAVAMYLGAPSALLMLLVGGGSLAGMLYVGFLALGFAPRLLGVIDVLLRPAECRRWGGAARLLAGAATDGVFSLIVGPVMMVAQTRFILGLAFGRRMIWEAQQRDDRRLEPGAAARGLWPQLVFGVVLLALHPVVWALPAVLGACLAIPFATITANPRLGGWMCRNGLCAIPEETARH
jgi:membrane glycosyltransferase